MDYAEVTKLVAQLEALPAPPPDASAPWFALVLGERVGLFSRLSAHLRGGGVLPEQWEKARPVPVSVEGPA